MIMINSNDDTIRHRFRIIILNITRQHGHLCLQSFSTPSGSGSGCSSMYYILYSIQYTITIVFVSFLLLVVVFITIIRKQCMVHVTATKVAA